MAADMRVAYRWLQEGKALPSWPPFGEVGARKEAASTWRALGGRFAKRPARSPFALMLDPSCFCLSSLSRHAAFVCRSRVLTACARTCYT